MIIVLSTAIDLIRPCYALQLQAAALAARAIERRSMMSHSFEAMPIYD